jgi:lysozyme
VYDKLLEEIKRDEGLRLNAYKDSLGNWTIGYGHLLGSTARMVNITIEEAEALLSADIDTAESLVMALVDNRYGLSDVRWRVLVNMAFNLGGRLRQFKKFLAAVDAQDWGLAAVNMLDSRWAKQVGARATRLAHMMEFNKESA